MRHNPEISVVMSVYNDAHRLRKSVESVLAQEGVSFEFVIIDDGSIDGSFELLSSYASKDSRIRLERQGNTGLTRALRLGCSLAKGTLITRQDAGDVYSQKKLKSQAEILRENNEVTMVTCGTRFLGPRGEFLFDVQPTTEQVDRGLRSLDISTIRGPSSHTSMMFRKDDYERAGGYRVEFAVSQDLDLWLRLLDAGHIFSIPEILVQGQLSPNSISGSSRVLQVQLGEILIECARRRQRGETEQDLLLKASALKRNVSGFASAARSESSYFIGRLLQRNRDRRCLQYLREAVMADPLNWKAWLICLRAMLASWNWPPINHQHHTP